MIGRRQRKRVKQRDRRVRNLDEFWGRKYRAAQTPQAKALVAWDQVRAGVRGLAPEEQDEMWRKVRDHLDVLIDGPLSSGGGPQTTAGRAHAGHRAPLEER